jgi:pre-mRNA processing factor 4 (PRP4) like
LQGGHTPTSIAAAAAELLNTALPKEVEGVSNQEAVRRLRLLGHPATLFGESDTDRLLRLHVIQQNISLQAQVRRWMKCRGPLWKCAADMSICAFSRLM